MNNILDDCGLIIEQIDNKIISGCFVITKKELLEYIPFYGSSISKSENEFNYFFLTNIFQEKFLFTGSLLRLEELKINWVRLNDKISEPKFGTLTLHCKVGDLYFEIRGENNKSHHKRITRK